MGIDREAFTAVVVRMMMMIRMFMPIGLVYVLRNSIDTSDETNIGYMRVFFVTGKLLVLALYAAIYKGIQNNQDTRTVKVTQADLQPPNPFQKAMGADSFNSSVPDIYTYPVYDQLMLNQKFTQLVMQCCIIGFLHYYQGLVIPLVLSVVMGVYSLPSEPLVQIYLRGRDPTNPEYAQELKRPFKPQSAFGDMLKPWQDMQEAQKKQEEKREARKAKKAAKQAAN